jgi:hypothetical protein
MTTMMRQKFTPDRRKPAVKSAASASTKGPAPLTTGGDKRAFDMRPKPGSAIHHREDPRYRPPQHVFPVLDDPESGTDA